MGDPARVLNVSSVGGMVSIGQDSPVAAYAYGASKAAVIHLSKSLARVLANRQITTNVICPGLFMTKMNAHLADEKIQDGAAKMNPIGRNGKKRVFRHVVLLANSSNDLSCVVCFRIAP
jgi:NAD(P)-dependent dehydrogenase (short-subunit alcohol dehydrogenase family)